MREIFFGLALLIAPVLVWSCSSGGDAGPSGPDNTSMAVRSDESAVIQTPAGARITVPLAAVPPTVAGDTGTIVFSIERVLEEVTVDNPPSDLQQVGSTYRFGPDGFVFGTPVEVAIPVAGNYRIGELMLARINPTTRQLEMVSADYDPVEGVVKGMTYHLSDWQVLKNAPAREGMAYGRIGLENNISDLRVQAHVSYIREAFAGQELPFVGSTTMMGPNNWSNWASGWGNHTEWTIPQGQVRICLDFLPVDGWDNPRHVILPAVELFNPDGWVSPPQSATANYELSIDESHLNSAIPGTCPGTPPATSSVGTGEVQVTLTWHSHNPIDLDLWVYDSDNELCNFLNPVTVSGGKLDRDNRCSNYVSGWPENIFWETAPVGTYRVFVHWYSSCSSESPHQTFSVRVVNGWSAKTYQHLVVPGDEAEFVAEFEVTDR